MRASLFDLGDNLLLLLDILRLRTSRRLQTPSTTWWGRRFTPKWSLRTWRRCSPAWTSTRTGWSAWRSSWTIAAVQTKYNRVSLSSHNLSKERERASGQIVWTKLEINAINVISLELIWKEKIEDDQKNLPESFVFPPSTRHTSRY